MYLIHVEETPGYVLDQIRSSVELAEMFSLWQTLFSAPLLKLQIDARETCLVLLTWKCDRTQVKGFLYLFQREESLNMDQPHPYMKPYLKQDLVAIASCCICVACRKRWRLRSLRSKTDSATACSTWLGCKIKASALLRVEQSLTTHLHHEMPSLTCRHSLMVFFIVCFLPHKKRHQSSPPEANHRTSEPLWTAGIEFWRPFRRRAARGTWLALHGVSAISVPHHPPSFPPSLLFTTSCMLSTPSLPGKMSEAWVNRGIHKSFQGAEASFLSLSSSVSTVLFFFLLNLWFFYINVFQKQRKWQQNYPI